MSKIVTIFATDLIWENMEKIFELWFFLTAIGVLGMLICAWKTSYCFVFRHRDWIRWEELIKNKDKIDFKYHYVFDDKPSINNYEFTGEMYGKKVMVKYWEQVQAGDVSVHSLEGKDCILCSFDTYHVKKMRKVLEKKIEAFEAGKQLITEVARDYLID